MRPVVILVALAAACSSDSNPVCEGPLTLASNAEAPPQVAACEADQLACVAPRAGESLCQLDYDFVAQQSGLHIFSVERVAAQGSTFAGRVRAATLEAGGEPVCADSYYGESKEWREAALCLESGDAVRVSVADDCFAAAPIVVRHALDSCPGQAIHGALPRGLTVSASPYGHHSLPFTCAESEDALQEAVAFEAPEAGDYTFIASSYQGVALALYDGDCCGQELACAVGEDEVLLTYTLEAGQRVMIGAGTDQDSADSKDIRLTVL